MYEGISGAYPILPSSIHPKVKTLTNGSAGGVITSIGIVAKAKGFTLFFPSLEEVRAGAPEAPTAAGSVALELLRDIQIQAHFIVLYKKRNKIPIEIML